MHKYHRLVPVKRFLRNIVMIGLFYAVKIHLIEY
jgi:hypothetical protein